jgi:hypothetical protein
VDEEDFKLDRRPSRKRPRPPDRESPLQSLVKKFVLKTMMDFVLKAEVAREINSTSADVGPCLGILEEEGLLERKLVPRDEEVDPWRILGREEHDAFRWKYAKVKWTGKFWGVGPADFEKSAAARGLKKSHLSKREIAEWDRKHLPVDTGWDGYAHYVVRGPEFMEAAFRAGLPRDPFEEWICTCGVKSFRGQPKCICGKSQDDSPGTSSPGPPRAKQRERAPVCTRCGARIDMAPRKGSRLHPFHGLIYCNSVVVTKVMEE